MFYFKKNYPLFLALLFHITGALGILFTPYKDWFVNNTPLVLVTMFFLLSKSQTVLSKKYPLFYTIVFIIGMLTEMIGVNTGLLFGHYAYGEVLGPKLYGVPILIGLNWFIIVFCAGSIFNQITILLQAKFNIKITKTMLAIMVVIGGATLATCFDMILEPVAIKLHFWTWEHGQIPLFNYICWFVISAVMLSFNVVLKISYANPFASKLLMIEALFFLVLGVFL